MLTTIVYYSSQKNLSFFYDEGRRKYIILNVACENYDDPRTISEECVEDLTVKELQSRHVVTKCVSLTLLTGVG